MRRILDGLTLYLGIVGLWDHDIRMIFAAVSVALIWPLISRDIGVDSAREAELDRLWDDDE